MEPPTTAAAPRGFVLWLHGSGQTGEESRARIAPYLSGSELASVRLLCPTAPKVAIECYDGEVINAWFGIPEIPINASTTRDETEVLKAVEFVHEILNKEVADGTNPANIFVCGLSQGEVLKAVEFVHEILNKEVADGTNPANIFVCGLSQGGALATASVLLYPKTLGGCAIFSGSIPLRKSFAERVPPEARKTPVLWFHGMADGLVLFETGHAGCAFMQELGMTCEFKTYPTLGHSLVDEELQYFRQWLLARLGISQGTEVGGPSSSSNNKDLH